MIFETTDDGSIVLYIKTNDKGVPIQIETDENKIKAPYHVRYTKI